MGVGYGGTNAPFLLTQQSTTWTEELEGVWHLGHVPTF